MILGTLFTPQYSVTSSYVNVVASNHISGYSIVTILGGVNDPGLANDHGAVRYCYYNDEQDDEILNKIEKEKLLILDESEEGSNPMWYDVIDPKILEDNLNRPISPDTHKKIEELQEEMEELQEEIEDNMINQLSNNISPPRKPSLVERILKILKL
jgi:hypothetical protein